MATEIEQDAATILELAVRKQDEADSHGGQNDLSGQAINEATGLSLRRINDAVAVLRANNFLDGYDFTGDIAV
jgi:hypothetical protein